MVKNFKNAFFAAIMAGIIIAPIFGVNIVRAGMQSTLQPEWRTLFSGMGIVFVFQWLIRPALAKFFGRKITRRALPVMSETVRRGLIVLMIAIALIWPMFTGRAQVDIATLVLIYIMLGLGLNIVVGFAGLLDLGFVGFYAVGAYTYALLYHWAGWGFWQALPLAGAMSALFGFVLGFPVLRLRGDYLAIVTLGFGEIIRLLLINLYSFTGGPDGISGIPKPSVFGFPMLRRAPEGVTTFHELVGWTYSTQDVIVFLYLMALCLALITLFVSNRVIRMPIGRAWEALREDEIACRSLGLNPTRIKLSAFTMGAMFAGFGGAFFAARQGLVNPESFTFIESALILAIVVLGGMGSQVGVILAAIVLTVVPEVAREFAEYRMLIFGLVMVLMMMWRPQGLLPVKRPHVELKT
ncbi:high-affinity branched-chain amino acid ABC transporter permease LivM [Allopusillimonas ginsengisoli]|uniref:high-affinity branched-chain amino acid ABC transporter permease LivM n=1 Tax=Allopusillimonas ginsengisoli TaxID=453575 RepID=UPI00101F6796|nr:high-affinity branched-chain amino acid ABC transporter permease LivM [Allopusillimonas ginsengisoli]TEA72292.1 high-affinity branched-chain amino acid ABC transporter permease LivM [Allopusillimonas ginsengisoli]